MCSFAVHANAVLDVSIFVHSAGSHTKYFSQPLAFVVTARGAKAFLTIPKAIEPTAINMMALRVIPWSLCIAGRATKSSSSGDQGNGASLELSGNEEDGAVFSTWPCISSSVAVVSPPVASSHSSGVRGLVVPQSMDGLETRGYNATSK